MCPPPVSLDFKRESWTSVQVFHRHIRDRRCKYIGGSGRNISLSNVFLYSVKDAGLDLCVVCRPPDFQKGVDVIIRMVNFLCPYPSAPGNTTIQEGCCGRRYFTHILVLTTLLIYH